MSAGPVFPCSRLPTIETLLGSMLIFSSTSSSSMTSTRVGSASISRPVRVDVIVTSPNLVGK
jgi:hypothetical protein